ncbi:MAG: response regulator [Vicinamibacteria bacterium]
MRPRTILAVEDNPITRKMLRFAFESRGYTVLEAGDGQTALNLASRQPPDIVVTDYILPDTDGLQLLERLRSAPGASETPAILVTGLTSRIDELRRRAGPRTSVFAKPIEPTRLLEAVGGELDEVPATVGRGRRVLVVDDEYADRELASHLLTRAGFEVETAADGDEGLRMARAGQFDAVLSDVLMPGMDGFLLCEAVRRDARLAHLPVVLTSSSYLEEADDRLAAQMGADAFVVKTPDMQREIHALLDVLSRSRSSPPPSEAEEVDRLYKDRLRAQLQRQVLRNEALVRQGAIQAAALSVVRGLAGVLARPEELPSVIGDVLIHCLDATGVSTGLLYLIEADGSLGLHAQAGLPPEARADAAVLFGHPGLFRAILDAGDPVASAAAQATSAPALRGLAQRLGKAFTLLIPFVVAGQPIGLLVLAADAQDLSEPAWLGFARALAGQFGQAIAVGRSLSRGAASEARYRSLMEHANDAILLLNDDDVVVEANRQADALLGRPREEIVGHAYEEFVVPEERQAAAQSRETTLAQGSNRVFGRHLLRLDGSSVPVELSSARVQVGPEALALLILRDVAERERSEAAVRERERLATFTSDVSAAIVLEEQLQPALRRCCEAAVRHLDAAFARIWTLDEAQDVLELQASAGMYTHLDGAHGRVPVGKFKIGLIAAERRPHLTNSVVGDPRVNDQDWARREGMVAFAGYPLIVGTSLVGVIAMFARRTLSDADLQALAAVAHQIALVIVRDRDQAALRASEERTRRLVSANPAVIYALRVGRDGEVALTWVSDNMERLLGYTTEQALAPGWWVEGVHPEDRDIAYAHVAALDEDQLVREYRFRHSGGGYRWIRDEQRLLRDALGPVEIVGSWSDVSERQAAEQQLQESEEQYRVLFDSNPHPMWVYDAETLQFLAVNESARRHYGYTLEEFLGMTIRDVRPPEEVPALEERLAGLSQAPPAEPKSRLWTHLRKDGSLIQVEVTSSPITFAGRAARLTLIHDVTEKADLERQLLQAQKLESIGRLAGGVAHDFNNLLGVITGYGELLHRHVAVDDRLRKYVDDILQAAQRAADLTRQLLAFSRRQVLQPKVLHLNGIVENMERMLRRLIGEDVRLVTALGDGVGLVRSDPGQIEQVVMNLVVNARDAMPKGGRLVIETANAELDARYARAHQGVVPGRYVLLAVSDSGHGMTEEVKARIFDPFFTTKGEGKGTGLGLSTVYGIVKQSGGYVGVYSEPGHGTVFKVYLPRLDAAQADQPTEVSPPAALPRGSETVLLVEDEPSLRALVRESLESCGYAVLDARQGADALALSGGHPGPIQLLLTDVVMPGMSGRELAAELAKSHPEAKVLYISGYTDDAVVVHGVLSEEMAFLQKPFSLDALARKVREVLDKQG